jgi:dTDP-4-amino-4,6-dideoxygalactose transaminase
MGDEYLVFGAPLIGEEEIEEVVQCLRSGWVGTGPRVQRFEEAFRAYRGAEHAVAVSSCTAALHLSMLASGIGPGDEVITTPLTFCATVNAIIHAGATPVLADCDPRSFCLDPEAVRDRITPRTRAIMPVHFAGRACDMDALMAIAREHGLIVIEDCAHAIETTWRGQAVGTFGDYGCFSFYVTKNVITGEGGMILTRDADAADRLRVLALHGMSRDAWKRFSDSGYKHYDVVSAGFKNNMTDLQAALGIHQLARVETTWARRQKLWDRYERELADLPVTLPTAPEAHVRHGLHLFTLLIEQARTGIDRDGFLEAMGRAGLGVGVHYRSIPSHGFYRDRFGWRNDGYPHAARIGASTVSIPLSAKLSDDQQTRVITGIRRFIPGR